MSKMIYRPGKFMQDRSTAELERLGRLYGASDLCVYSSKGATGPRAFILISLNGRLMPEPGSQRLLGYTSADALIAIERSIDTARGSDGVTGRSKSGTNRRCQR